MFDFIQRLLLKLLLGGRSCVDWRGKNWGAKEQLCHVDVVCIYFKLCEPRIPGGRFSLPNPNFLIISSHLNLKQQANSSQVDAESICRTLHQERILKPWLNIFSFPDGHRIKQCHFSLQSITCINVYTSVRSVSLWSGQSSSSPIWQGGCGTVKNTSKIKIFRAQSRPALQFQM